MKEKKIKNLAQIHPGEILQDEFLMPFKITNDMLSREACICINELNELLKGNKHITEDIAAKLGDFFKTTPQFWLGLQSNYDKAVLK